MGMPEGEEWEPFAGPAAQPSGLARFLADAPFAAGRPRRLAAAASPVPAAAGRRPPAGRFDPGRVSAASSTNSPARRRPLADAHRHHLAGCHRLDQPRRLGQPARPVRPASRSADSSAKRRSPRPSAGHGARRPAHRARHRREQPLPAAGRARPHRTAVRRAADSRSARSTIPFINRGLDALNYACYQDARFMLVATPSGITLAPEGGAHQSIRRR